MNKPTHKNEGFCTLLQEIEWRTQELLHITEQARRQTPTADNELTTEARECVAQVHESIEQAVNAASEALYLYHRDGGRVDEFGTRVTPADFKAEDEAR
jgi:hypothetical protein